MFFFFSSRRRHTRSLCDWSSDVCSSDLKQSIWLLPPTYRNPFIIPKAPDAKLSGRPTGSEYFGRSEERRVGKECRSRWSPDHGKKKEQNDRWARTSRQVVVTRDRYVCAI